MSDMEPEEMDEFYEWLQKGIDRKWCTDVACSTHDVVEMTDEEMEAWEEGWDPCIFVVRIWE